MWERERSSPPPCRHVASERERSNPPHLPRSPSCVAAASHCARALGFPRLHVGTPLHSLKRLSAPPLLPLSKWMTSISSCALGAAKVGPYTPQLPSPSRLHRTHPLGREANDPLPPCHRIFPLPRPHMPHGRSALPRLLRYLHLTLSRQIR